MQTRIRWHAELRRLDAIKPNPKNPRIIDEESKAFQDTMKSVDKFGLAEPIVINADDTIIGGHARRHIEMKLGTTEVECWVPERMLTEQEVDELMLRLNKNVAGKWDMDKLLDFDQDFLTDVGFEADEINLNFDLLSGEERTQEQIKSNLEKLGELVKLETMMRPDERDVLMKAVNHIKLNHPSHTTLADCLVYLANDYNTQHNAQ
jgi:ParB-like chromosome segregation protein Spo0J